MRNKEQRVEKKRDREEKGRIHVGEEMREKRRWGGEEGEG